MASPLKYFPLRLACGQPKREVEGRALVAAQSCIYRGKLEGMLRNRISEKLKAFDRCQRTHWVAFIVSLHFMPLRRGIGHLRSLLRRRDINAYDQRLLTRKLCFALAYLGDYGREFMVSRIPRWSF
jgi:hypothetical protein